MSTYVSTVTWERGDQPFSDGKYSRAHTVSFDGGVSIAGSSSPAVVRPPLSKVDAADPEEMLVASLSMCHMLFFLDLARKAKFVVDSYVDAAEGIMDRDDRGAVSMVKVTLKPQIAWAPGPDGRTPTVAEIDDMHHRSHELCYIANSFRGEVVVESR
jgi:organic hydroperoxide reductase OsmC/OhrA